MKRYFLILCLFYSFPCFSQTNQHPFHQHYTPEEWAVQWLGHDRLLDDQRYQQWITLWERPLNINQASKEEVLQLNILTPNEVKALFEHLEKYGKLLSVYELQSIQGWTDETVFKILPLISVEEQGLSHTTLPLKEKIKRVDDHYWAMRWSPSPSSNTPYLGPQHQLYARWRFQQKDLFKAGLTLEKDIGEPYSHGHIGGYLQWNQKGLFKQVTLGDFQLQTGQGLVFNGGFQLGKGAETIASVMQQHREVTPYGAVTESGFLRGIALTFQLQKFKWIILGSLQKEDAGIDEQGYRLVQTGLRRTPSEIEKANQIRHQTVGHQLEWSAPTQSLTIGHAMAYTSFNQNLSRGSHTYQIHQFSGKTHLLNSLYFKKQLQNWTFFGEMAVTEDGYGGGIIGGILSLGKKLDLSWLYRNYSPKFHSFYGGAFSENTSNKNEKGYYFGSKLRLSKKWLITTYLDLFEFPWLKYRVHAPSYGHEFLIRSQYRVSKKLRSYFQYKKEQKGRNTGSLQGISAVEAPVKQQFSLFLEWLPSKTWRFKTQFLHTNYSLDNSTSAKSYLIAQDLFYKSRYFQFYFRTALFEAPIYDSRFYLYENHVPYTFSYPAYHGSGLRNVVMMRVKPWISYAIWVRYAHTMYVSEQRSQEQLTVQFKMDLKKKR